MHFFSPTSPQPNRPLFCFLPGMDGTGRLLRTQQPQLARSFDLRCLSIPPEDLSGWEILVDRTVGLIEAELERNRHRDLYLCGESFGGCLALKVALKIPHRLKRLILVNPASSFKQRPWVQWGSYLTHWLPSWFYPVSVTGMLPFLAALRRITQTDRRALLEAMQSVPQQTSIWRLELLRSFHVEPRQLRQLGLPAVVIASGSDRLLPSVTEAQFLTRELPDAEMVVLPDSGHACLLETDVNLYAIVKDCDPDLDRPTKDSACAGIIDN